MFFLTTLSLLRIIKTAEWRRYTGHDPTHIKAGTTGEDAITLRLALPTWGHAADPLTIEYRPVGSDGDWYPTGFKAIARHSLTEPDEPDGDGHFFAPYTITALTHESLT